MSDWGGFCGGVYWATAKTPAKANNANVEKALMILFPSKYREFARLMVWHDDIQDNSEHRPLAAKAALLDQPDEQLVLMV